MKSALSASNKVPPRLLFMPVFVIILFATNLQLDVIGGDLSEANLAEFGVSLASLERGEWFRLVTGSFISHDTDMLIRQLILAMLALGWYEWHLGTLRAVFMFFTLDILGTLFLMFVIIFLIEAIDIEGYRGLSETLDVGMSAGGFGLIGASLSHLKWRNRALVTGIAMLALKALTFPEPIADIAHLLMLPVGFLCEAVLTRIVLTRQSCPK